ncbi:MAG: hypothetical protein II821_06300 [Treponema sp.]|nr:hypothetical protein [Treponema sp.]
MKSHFFSHLSMFFVVLAMVSLAELTGEKEIIFPEVAALSAGCFLTPALVWKTSYLRMFLCISICALLGVLIVIFVPLPLWGQFVLGFTVGQAVLYFSRTSFAPMISAIALPVLIQTRSFVYVVAAIGLTLLVVILRFLLEKIHFREENHFDPVNIEPKEVVRVNAFRIIFVAFLSFFCIRFDMKFCVAPPLLVAFTELTNRNSGAVKRPFSVVALVSLCAVCGSVSRILFSSFPCFPLTIAAFVACICVQILVKVFKMPFPPAAAMSVLAFLIPETAVKFYPLQVAAGITLLTIFALGWKRARVWSTAEGVLE